MDKDAVDENVVLGIHSAGGNGGFTDGHAWLTVKRGDKPIEYYGLWPDNHPAVPDNGEQTDIRVGMEKGAKSQADRYYELTPAQVKELDKALAENVKWELNHNCSSWASETASRVTGQTIDAGTWLPTVETPNALIHALKELEAKHPTSAEHPQEVAPAKERGSSSMHSDPQASAQRTGVMTDPAHPGHALFAGLREALPPQITDERVALAAIRAHGDGMTDLAQVGRVIEQNGDIHVAGVVPGYRASVMANEVAPALESTSQAFVAQASALQAMEPAQAQARGPSLA